MYKYCVRFTDEEVEMFNGLCEGYDVRDTVANFCDKNGDVLATIPVDRIKAIYREDAFVAR